MLQLKAFPNRPIPENPSRERRLGLFWSNVGATEAMQMEEIPDQRPFTNVGAVSIRNIRQGDDLEM